MFDKICNLFCGSHKDQPNAEVMRQLLGAQGRGVLSASCCAPMAAKDDDTLVENLRTALATVGEADDVPVINITEAQKVVRQIRNDLSPDQQRVIQQIEGMVASQGFSVFPVLLIEGKVAFYGGVPTPEMIIEKLKQSVPVAPDMEEATAAVSST